MFNMTNYRLKYNYTGKIEEYKYLVSHGLLIIRLDGVNITTNDSFGNVFRSCGAM